jgi:transposase
MKQIDEERIAVWVGLDWADEEHVYALRMAGSERIETGSVKQKPEDLREWINSLRDRSGGGWVAVAVEQSRGALLYALMDYEFLFIYPVNPKSLAKYRQAFYPGGGKDDPRDADLILDYLLKHRDRMRLWQPESPEVRCLRMLSEERRKLVDLRTELTNQLTANLKNYFPQALQWVSPLKETTACEFLERWPSLQELQKPKPSVIRRFFRSHGARGLERLEARILEMRQAQALTRDWAILTAGGMLTQSLARQIGQLNESVALFDRKIEELFKNHGDHVIFSSLPGSGPALGPRLLALFGDDRERFDSSEQVQAMSGVAPLMSQSGKTRIVHYRHACPKFMRQSIHEFAAHSRKWCPWAEAFYQTQVSKGKKHNMAVRSLAFKWLRIIFRCWKDGTPYDDALYMASLKANNAPLLAYLR